MDQMLGIRLPHHLPVDLLARLAAAQVCVSVRGRFIRVSPHVDNIGEDVRRFVEVLAQAL